MLTLLMLSSLLAGLTAVQAPADGAIVLEGTITAANRLAWLERSFTVPAGTARIDVDTSFTQAAQGTALEFGIYDPVRFRGASRFSKQSFFISRTAATPSYHPGEMPAGEWRLLIGVPTIRDGIESRYRIVVRLTKEGPIQPPPSALPAAIAASGPKWYQGDLHTHTMHSDGYGCANGTGGSGPCAVHQVVDAASRLGLDFVAVTDHNTTSHHNDLAELQLQHDRLLLVRGQEVTTFYGHANVYGISEMVDFRIGHPGVTASDVFNQARRLGGLLSINHPARETGEKCTGCGWNAPGTDWAQIEVMEVVNGVTVSGPTAGEPFWHARLNEGHRITGVGGSDDHGASTRAGSAVGIPTTVIHADALTEAALLAGIRAGHVYIKPRGPDGPDVRFEAPEQKASMGDAVKLAAGARLVAFRLTVLRAAGQKVDVIRNGKIVDNVTRNPLASNDVTLDFSVEVRPGDWVRITVRDGAGATVIGNPIYFK
jgi:hypothetical protein